MLAIGSIVAALLLAQHSFASNVQVFSDGECQTEAHDWTGPNNGECTALTRQGNYSSFSISNLQLGCAITIYGPGTQGGPCNPKAAPGAIVAQPGKCYNTTWAFYSIDGCNNAQSSIGSSSVPAFTSTAFSSKTVLTSTKAPAIQTSSASSPTTSPNPSGGSSTNIGAIVGGVIGGVAVGILATIGILICLRRRRRARLAPPEYRDGPGSSHGLAEVAAKEAPGLAHYQWSRPGTAGSVPGSLHQPAELPNEGIPEMPSHALSELPAHHRGTYTGPKGMSYDVRDAGA